MKRRDNWTDLFLNPWVIVGAILVAAVLLTATCSLAWLMRPAAQAPGRPTALLNVIPAPSATNTGLPATPTPLTSPTPTLLVPPAPTDIRIDATVQITGTGGDGLRLRVDPGLKGQVRVLGGEAEVFVVRDGPRQADGLTWWYLEGFSDKSRRGWAVANFLALVEQPQQPQPTAQP